MRKVWALLGSAIFFVIAPATFILYLPWAYTRFEIGPPFFGIAALRIVGAALAVIGLVPLVESFLRFALKGLGTPAPIAPPTKLVVTGFYRHTRNPMYVGLAVTMLGEALLFGSRPILWEALIVTLGFHVFVLIYEEPTLRQSFGEQYETYRANVPRWLPRWTAWTQPG
ncbi:MAG: isoprenylcysteine carboxylmethyltransferase family protein [Alphaproteobacteria bacterium]|nr:isoprenylcysteine carboxylmethyltransferase family protein [Alphaproteobacteria bacterium]MBV9419646.1 isoprenylcysteine carboxylmethyltransferase family protein [Alphaproteobacteria bacterium]MBV9539916.1 isoprenylcysteine carboxylmethyltransferase family protein [Alphaproteobacteria bacterium]MBV9904116.1 isoprenylcysteine carboxylmethyltransferase family protein [Alphaproteobacteria bacterium]